MIWAVEKLQSKLERLVGEQIAWRWNTNENSILSVTRQRKRPRFKVSIHRIFLKAEPDFLPHLAEFIRQPTPRARAAVRLFIHKHDNQIEPRAWFDSPQAICPRGRHYNLAALARRINDQYFNGRLTYNISWGRWGARPARLRSFSSIQLGSYNEKRRLIRIHPILDDRSVPEFFLKFIIYHEMCHIECPPRILASGRVVYHSPEFRRRERLFAHFDQALDWEKNQLPRLIAARKNK
ncbi:MAG: hypothetical protein Kow0059_22070 [Candidatus Sumerlaeia bacterium]